MIYVSTMQGDIDCSIRDFKKEEEKMLQYWKYKRGYRVVVKLWNLNIQNKLVQTKIDMRTAENFKFSANLGGITFDINKERYILWFTKNKHNEVEYLGSDKISLTDLIS